MPSSILFILTLLLFYQSIIMLIVRSGFRKRETIILYGMYFLFNAILSAILLYPHVVPYKIKILECLLGYALFFTFFFLFWAWNSLVVEAKQWLQYSKKIMIGGIIAGTLYAVIIAFHPFEELNLLTGHNNMFNSGSWGIKTSMGLMVIITGILIFIYMKQMISVNLNFLDYIMNNYSYIEKSLINYRNGIIAAVAFVIIAFLTDLLMIFYFNTMTLIIYATYQLIYIYIVMYYIFNFSTYNNVESKVTVYFMNFMSEVRTEDFNRFFYSKDSEVLLEDKYDELRKKLITYFEESKPYMSKKLVMTDIAKELNTNRTYISKIINSDYNTTFFNFVNVFRIEEAKKQIETTSSYSLKAIADSCGFSSYTTFAKYHKMYRSKSADWYRKREVISR